MQNVSFLFIERREGGKWGGGRGGGVTNPISQPKSHLSSLRFPKSQCHSQFWFFIFVSPSPGDLNPIFPVKEKKKKEKNRQIPVSILPPFHSLFTQRRV